MVAYQYYGERIFFLIANSILWLLYTLQIISEPDLEKTGITKYWYHRYGFIANTLAVIQSVDPNAVFGVYGEAYPIVVFCFRNNTLFICATGFAATFFSIRSFYEIQNRPLPKWIKPILISVIIATFIVINICTIIGLIQNNNAYGNVILFWLFALGLIYDVVFNYGFQTLRSIVTQYRTGQQAQQTNDAVSKGLENMKRYQIVATVSVTIAAIICLGLGFVEIQQNKDPAYDTPDTYYPDWGILMGVQVALWLLFLWFSWVPIRFCGITIGHDSTQSGSRGGSRGSRVATKQKSNTSIPRSPSEADKRPTTLNISATAQGSAASSV